MLHNLTLIRIYGYEFIFILTGQPFGALKDKEKNVILTRKKKKKKGGSKFKKGYIKIKNLLSV
jgi:hypothetical protein